MNAEIVIFGNDEDDDFLRKWANNTYDNRIFGYIIFIIIWNKSKCLFR